MLGLEEYVSILSVYSLVQGIATVAKLPRDSGKYSEVRLCANILC